MEIKNEKFNINNTYRFIFPILRMYGFDYMSHMASMYKQGVFIDDITYPNPSNKDRLYIVVNTSLSKTIAEDINFFEKQSYVPKIYIHSIHRHTKAPIRMVVVFDMPLKYNNIFNKFIKGEYYMFEPNDVNTFFKPLQNVNEPFFRYCRNVLLRKNKISPPNFNDEILGL